MFGVFFSSVFCRERWWASLCLLCFHMTTFSVFEQQRKRGVTRHCADFKGDVWRFGTAFLVSHTHTHKSKCLLPLNVSLWPLECLSHRKLYILCFFLFSGGEHCLSCCGYFLQAVFQMAQTRFFLLAAPQKEIYKDNTLQTIHHRLKR